MTAYRIWSIVSAMAALRRIPDIHSESGALSCWQSMAVMNMLGLLTLPLNG
ncbi:hypothetical protein ACFX5Q_32125 [Mesorhizobium sp. IMUNJ 23033]|uniref:hypothetical protein n=1 Tax=Mesorhizobium sp. IMUNJ 23033 TaxID=3378039 RepID=UPI00384BD374